MKKLLITLSLFIVLTAAKQDDWCAGFYEGYIAGWNYQRPIELQPIPSWSNDVIIRVQKPDENSKMTAPYLYVESRFGRVPWKETMIELFSNDWELVD